MNLSNMPKPKRRLHLLTFAFIFAVGSAIAQNSENTLLFKVEGPDIQTSYLYGTIHVLPQKDFNLKDKVKIAFDTSELIVMELDMDDPGMQIEMVTNAMMKGDNTLDKLFEAEDYAKLDQALRESVGMGVAAFNKMKPFIVSSMLLMKYVGEQPASFEGTFVQMAQAAQKEILGLETVTQQLNIFDEIPYEEQVEDIIEMLDNPESTKDMYHEMVEVYKTEDIKEMYAMMETYFDNDEESIQALLHKRNNNWIPKIGELARDRSTFFAVGAGHLGGKQGVIQLLRENGYTVTPILDSSNF